MKPVIHFQQTVKMIHGHPPLRIDDLRIYEKECVAFYGLTEDIAEIITNQITGAYAPEEGSIYIHGNDSREITDTSWFDFVGNFGIYSTSAPLQENASIGENIAMIFRSQDSSLDESRLSAAVLKLANLVHLTITDLSKIMNEASSLLRMKVRLARALAFRPSVVILREPTEEVSREVSQKLLDLLKRVRRKWKFTLLLFTSDIWLLQEVAERVLFLNPQTGIIVENQLRGWYHSVLPFLKPSPAKLLQLSRSILQYGQVKSSRV
jgi:ABC-type transporter Mla maintaining outer membrane lipid asymmetry ATPase subunit MlaF